MTRGLRIMAEMPGRLLQHGRRLCEAWERPAEARELVVQSLATVDPEATQVARALAAGDSGGAKALLDWVRAHPGPFVTQASAREGLAAALRASFPQETHAILGEAGEALAHRFRLLGVGLQSFGEEIPWQADPLSGGPWPDRHWWQIAYLQAIPGDPKFVWELNRLRFAVALARAWWLTGDERWAGESVRLGLSCVQGNPPGRGINWASSLEVAMRALALLWVYHLCLPAQAMTPEAHLVLLAGFLPMGRHLLRYPSTYTSPNTHLIGEGAALYALGVSLPVLREAARWRQAGTRLLDRCLRQILPDGGHVELSTHYHRYAMEYYQFAAAVARLRGEIPSCWREAIAAMTRWAATLANAHGWVERLGDSDGGSASFAPDREEGDYRHVFAVSAALLGWADLPGAQSSGEALWLLGPHDPPTRSESTVRASASLPHSGLVVLRDERLQAILDCGPHGGLGGGHAHADALAVTVQVDDKPVLVDRGTGSYTGEPLWRDHFRGTAAHNTMSVDGLPQSTPAGPFSWRRRARTRLCGWADGPAHGWVVGECISNYAGSSVAHRRQVALIKGGYLLVTDRVGGKGQHWLALHWHLPPGAGREEISIVTVWPESTQVWLEGGEMPGPGWHSDTYGRRTPAPTLRVERVCRLPQVIYTLLSPAPVAVAEREGRLLVRGEWGEDLVDCREGLSYARYRKGELVALGLAGVRCVGGPGGEVLLECGSETDYLHVCLAPEAVDFAVEPAGTVRVRTQTARARAAGVPLPVRREGDFLVVEGPA